MAAWVDWSRIDPLVSLVATHTVSSLKDAVKQNHTDLAELFEKHRSSSVCYGKVCRCQSLQGKGACVPASLTVVLCVQELTKLGWKPHERHKKGKYDGELFCAVAEILNCNGFKTRDMNSLVSTIRDLKMRQH